MSSCPKKVNEYIGQVHSLAGTGLVKPGGVVGLVGAGEVVADATRGVVMVHDADGGRNL